MSLIQAIGLSVFPNIGGIAGGFITRSQVKTWYTVSILSFFNLNGSNYKANLFNFNRQLKSHHSVHQTGLSDQFGLIYTLQWDMLLI